LYIGSLNWILHLYELFLGQIYCFEWIFIVF
jgi:hypothetical protein